MALNDNHNQMRSSMRRFFLLAGAAILCSTLAFAQFEPPHSKVPHQDKPEDDQAPTIKVDVNLVSILYSVKAKKGGALIPNLEQKDFTVFEDGKEQKIQRFTRETDLPITLGLLIDVSLSQMNLVDIERQAASSFFENVIRKKDEAFVISFGKDINLLQDMTGSVRQLTGSLHDLQPDAMPPSMGRVPVNTGPVPQGAPKGTLLYDAVVLASNEKLTGEVGRKALILITDGDDEGSTYDRKAAIQAAQKADAIIFSIYYVDRGFYSRYGGLSFGGGGEGELKKMSEETGGQVFTVSGKHPLSEVFKEIQEELRNQYSVAYSPDNPTRDGGFRRIEIKVDNPDYRVQSRNGYYATQNGGQ